MKRRGSLSIVSKHHKVIFLDRDGVINKAPILPSGALGSPATLEQFHLKEGILPFCGAAKQRGFGLIVFTNQPEVSRGNFIMEDMIEIEGFCRKRLGLLDYFACYHDDDDNCDCRKPKPGMLNMAATKWDLIFDECLLIGDREKDILAGRSAGIFSILLENHLFNSRNCCADAYIEEINGALRFL